MHFSHLSSGSRVNYTIDLDGKVPGVARLVKAMLTRNISSALRKFAEPERVSTR